MYADPSLIRDHVVKIRLNDTEAALIDAIVNFTGQQKATLLREILLDSARRVLVGEDDIAAAYAANEVQIKALRKA